MVKITLKYKNKKISLEVKRCGFFEKGVGLTFKSRANSKALLFDRLGGRSYALTALFVFFPFLVIWLDSENKVLDKRVVRPFTFFVDSKSNYKKIVEIPVSKRYSKIIELLDGN